MSKTAEEEYNYSKKQQEYYELEMIDIDRK